MKKSDELKQERASKYEELTGLVQTRKAENRDFTTEEETQFDSLEAEIRELDKKIEKEERFEAAEVRAAQMAGNAGESMRNDSGDTKEREQLMKRYSLHKALRSQLPNQKLDGVELEMHQEMQKRAREAGVTINGVGIPQAASEKRADPQTVTQDSGAYGGNLVATDHKGIIPFLRPKPIVESLGVRYMRGLTGDVKFATNDGGITATWEGEITEVDPSKNAYGSKTMTPNRLASTVPISLQNIFQSTPDLEQYTKDEMNAVIALKIDETVIEGPGTGNIPEGILANSDVNVVAVGTNGGAITWGQIVDLETAIYVANANSAKMAYLINPGTKGKLKKTKHEAGDATYLMGVGNELNGYPVSISNLVPNDLTKGTGTSLNAGIFGDWSQVMIGEWGFYDMVVDNISRKKEGLIEITVNSFLDILIKHGEAFAVVKDWDLTA